MKYFIAIMACLAVTACAAPKMEPTETANYPVISPITVVEFGAKKATEAERQECENAGGSVSPQGLLGGDFCVIPFADAGALCTDGSQCIGQCRADPALDSGETTTATDGTCQVDNNPFGCFATIENGKGSPMLCVD